MPLAVNDFTWEETEKEVFITVPLKGVKNNKVDILSTEEYLKVSYPPYLFECFLHAPVDDVGGTAQVGNGAVVFRLPKKNPGFWSKLHSDIHGDKEAMKQKREEAIKTSQEREQKKEQEKAEKKRADSKYALQETMKFEEAERKRIEDEKESERKKATEELEKWKEEQHRLAEEEKKKLLEEKLAAEAAREQKRMEEMEQKKKTKKRGKKNDIFEEAAEGVPKREVGKIEIKFTPRVFPTPVRESQTPQEEEWLRKQVEARRVQEVDEELTEEERNPMFLRDKGKVSVIQMYVLMPLVEYNITIPDSFFQSGNYLAAVNAFSHAIRLAPKMHSLYSNRAACHLKLKNFIKCVEDCSRALVLLDPPVPQNAVSRCKAYVRRGTAYCELELYVEGLKDYEDALKIDPNNEALRADADRIRQVIQGSSES